MEETRTTDMRTYVVELDHGLTRTVTEVEGETFDEAVQCARDLQGFGEVVSVLMKSCHDSFALVA